MENKNPPKNSILCLEILHNSIGVKVCLTSRGISSDSSCPRCRDEPETIIHLLWDYGGSKDLWK